MNVDDGNFYALMASNNTTKFFSIENFYYAAMTIFDKAQEIWIMELVGESCIRWNAVLRTLPDSKKAKVSELSGIGFCPHNTLQSTISSIIVTTRNMMNKNHYVCRHYYGFNCKKPFRVMPINETLSMYKCVEELPNINVMPLTIIHAAADTFKFEAKEIQDSLIRWISTTEKPHLLVQKTKITAEKLTHILTGVVPHSKLFITSDPHDITDGFNIVKHKVVVFLVDDEPSHPVIEVLKEMSSGVYGSEWGGVIMVFSTIKIDTFFGSFTKKKNFEIRDVTAPAVPDTRPEPRPKSKCIVSRKINNIIKKIKRSTPNSPPPSKEMIEIRQPTIITGSLIEVLNHSGDLLDSCSTSEFEEYDDDENPYEEPDRLPAPIRPIIAS